jgi:16S rRNA (cytosine967-C5)-methyltransferase
MDSRITALEILNHLDASDKTLDILLDQAHQKKKFAYKKDRALLQAIVFGVLRHKNRLDWIIAKYSNIPVVKINPIILNILRIGLFQIIYLDRIPVSASVNTSVDLAKMFAPVWTVKYVNAVLRNAATSFESVSFPDPEKDVSESLSVTQSFPEWLIRRWLERFGQKETQALCAAINTIAPITVRTNELRTTREKLFKSLESEVGEIWLTPISKEGISFLNPGSMISELIAFRLGWFQVQDEAAQLMTSLLEPRPKETILDACAGLGGKTGHIAQMMKNTGHLVAMDIEKHKLARLSEDMNRQFISIVKTHLHDLNGPLKGKPYSVYDRILLDAPCSGIGVLRRNPDAKWRIKQENFELYGNRQNLFLDNLAPAVKPGGILVYGVCSFEPEETITVVKTFLERHSEFILDPPSQTMRDLNPSLFSPEGYFMSFPHLHNMDGFFAARFSKIK